MWFLSHNSRSRYVRRSIKGSKDVDDCLVSKTILSQKNGSLNWCPWPGKIGQKFKNISSLWRRQQKIPNPNIIFFLNRN